MESLSAKQKQSLLQTAYRKFFKRVMKSLKLKKLKGQDKEVLAKLFITVKKGWPKEKKAALKAAMASSLSGSSSDYKTTVKLHASLLKTLKKAKVEINAVLSGLEDMDLSSPDNFDEDFLNIFREMEDSANKILRSSENLRDEFGVDFTVG